MGWSDRGTRVPGPETDAHRYRRLMHSKGASISTGNGSSFQQMARRQMDIRGELRILSLTSAIHTDDLRRITGPK